MFGGLLFLFFPIRIKRLGLLGGSYLFDLIELVVHLLEIDHRLKVESLLGIGVLDGGGLHILVDVGDIVDGRNSHEFTPFLR